MELFLRMLDAYHAQMHGDVLPHVVKKIAIDLGRHRQLLTDSEWIGEWLPAIKGHA